MSAFSSERSRPIWVDIAISAPARSIEAQATSISRLRITSRIEMSCTSTSYIDFSTVSGSMPWLIVRLPCGSMSTQSTRWPFSANAAARFRVVVVFATPPFWLANAITLAFGGVLGRRVGSGVTADSDRSGPSGNGVSLAVEEPISRAYSYERGGFLRIRDPYCCGRPGARPPRQAADLRDRQGRRRQVDRRGRPRPRRRARGQAHDRLRGGPPGAHVARLPAQGVGYHEIEIGTNLYAFSIDPERALRGVPAACSSRSGPLYDLLFNNRIFQYFAAATPGMRELVTIGKVWELAQLERRKPKAAAVRPRDRRRARDRPWSRHAAHAADVRGDRARRARSAARREQIDALHHRPEAHRRARGRAARGDAGQRDDRLPARAAARAGHGARRGGA